MITETTCAANTIAMKAVVVSLGDYQVKQGLPYISVPRSVPMLDWPRDLFADEVIYH